MSRQTMRFVTYLAPSIPYELFEFLARTIGERLGAPVSLRAEVRHSGPPPREIDPFSSGSADVGFLCSPPYIRLRALDPPPVDLVPAAPVFADPRCQGRPVYFSDVVVHRASPVQTLDQLDGGSWLYNDTCSLSGYYSLLLKIGEMHRAGRFFGSFRRSGSHVASLRLIADRSADAAAIDSNVLALWLAGDPTLRRDVRVIESWGPFPVQPIVARRGLGRDLTGRIAAVLLSLSDERAARKILGSFGIARFAPVSDASYDLERKALNACEALPDLLAAGSEVAGIGGGRRPDPLPARSGADGIAYGGWPHAPGEPFPA